jgi:hypothetical protein
MSMVRNVYVGLQSAHHSLAFYFKIVLQREHSIFYHFTAAMSKERQTTLSQYRKNLQKKGSSSMTCAPIIWSPTTAPFCSKSCTPP